MNDLEFIMAHRANLLAMAQAMKTLRDAILSDVRLIELKYNIRPEKGNGHVRTKSTEYYQAKGRESVTKED